MEEGKVPVPLKYFMSYKSERQRHFSLDTNVEKAMACLDCGYIEFFLNPSVLKAKIKELS